MHNGVVTAVARALATRGFVVLRFNFRGVGRSDGQHDNGRGEQADVAGALDWLLSQPQVDPWRVSLVGYSFGAWVGLMHVQTDPRVMAAAAIGLVAWHYDARLHEARHGPEQESRRQFAPGFLQSFTRPKLFVTGEHDSLAPLRSLRDLVDRLPSPKTLHVVAGTDHFFHGCEQEVGELVAGFLVNVGG